VTVVVVIVVPVVLMTMGPISPPIFLAQLPVVAILAAVVGLTVPLPIGSVFVIVPIVVVVSVVHPIILVAIVTVPIMVSILCLHRDRCGNNAC